MELQHYQELKRKRAFAVAFLVVVLGLALYYGEMFLGRQEKAPTEDAMVEIPIYEVEKYLPERDYSPEIEQLKQKIIAKEATVEDYDELIRLYARAGSLQKGYEFMNSQVSMLSADPLALYGRGVLQTRRRLFEEAREDLQSALERKPDFLEAWQRLGDTYVYEKNTINAGEAYNQALTLAREHQNQEKIGDLYGNLAQVAFMDNESSKALLYQQKAIDIHESQDSIEDLVIDYIMLGRIHSMKDEYDNAINAFRHAETLGLELGDRLLLAKVYAQWGVHHQRFGENVAAMDYFSKANTTLTGGN